MDTEWLIITLSIAVIIFLFRNKRYRWFYIIARTYRRDIRLFVRATRLINALLWTKIRNKTVPSTFSSLVKKHPHKVAFYFEDEIWTFANVEDLSNKIARCFKNQGLRKGDCIALMLENRPEYVCIWLGLSKIGVVTALINTNLVMEPLLHSIKSANCKSVIFGSNNARAIENILGLLKLKKLYQYHETTNETVKILPNCVNLKHELKSISCEPLAEDFQISLRDPILYIYTSGTTGLPKPAIITNMRYVTIAHGLYAIAGFTANDVVYTPMPFYHTSGNALGTGETVVKGLTLAIRTKFSASNYWKDCAKYNCTVAQYIGEMCRYVLSTPQDEPIKHSVRAIVGSGLRPQIWREFVNKFGIKEVYELYGATEGIANIMNIDSTVGAVGFFPRYFQWVSPVSLIKCNEVTGDPIRNENGRCIRCRVDEAGLMIGKIMQKKSVFDFEGYVDQKATQKKILRNVFRNGDAYFNSGDILLMDEFGYFFFKDRIGDTFRWKGENVSTAEVEGIVTSLMQLNDVIVYGVEIPNMEGRAGMAAIVDHNNTLDIDFLSNAVKQNLPPYSIPLFVRVANSLPKTGTFKLKKTELQGDGFNVDKIEDKIYFYSPKFGKYVYLTKETYEQIISGVLRL